LIQITESTPSTALYLIFVFIWEIGVRLRPAYEAMSPTVEVLALLEAVTK
jgi:hypothetical protein